MLVNNAGAIRRGGRIHEVDVATWDEQIGTNLRVTTSCCRPRSRTCWRAGDRSIVNVGSTLAHKVVSGIAPYAAAKGAMASLTRSLAVEYGLTASGPAR